MKTGTSSIQAALGRSPEILERAGWRYLGWPLRTPTKVQERLNEVPPDANVIVVDEGWWHFAPSRRVDLFAMAKTFCDFEVTVVVYFRRPDQYLEAWYSQGLKRGTGAVRVADFLVDPMVNRKVVNEPGAGPFAHMNLHILGTLRLLRKAFPSARIVTRPYERESLIGQDAVLDFLDVVGLDSDVQQQLVLPAEENITQDGADLLLLSLLRQRYGLPQDVLDAMLLLPKRPSGGRIFTFEEASGINEAMKPVFRRVQANWGGGGTTADFFADWTLDPDTYRVSPFREVYDRALAAE